MQILTNDKHKRLLSLDALRGLSILLMVLSGSIAFKGVMPAWMYHAQVPPPLHRFNPNIPGITWVDLVFPFFLFSMGAAFPIALNKKLENSGLIEVMLQIVKRYLLLIFFAIFIFHSRAWVMSDSPGIFENIISICCFLLLFLLFSKSGNNKNKKFLIALKVFAFCVAITFLYLYPFKGKEFDFAHSDIIIIVLANMAFFGSIIWVFTRENSLLRLAILPFIMAAFLSAKAGENWVSQIFNWSPAPWAYSFYYLKYLFIIIPGTFAGDWFLKIKHKQATIKPSMLILAIATLCLLLLVVNINLLFSRALLLNVTLTLCLSLGIVLLFRKAGLHFLYQNFIKAGIFLLVLGLVFEPYEEGIKKDPSTYSYYFVSSGLAFLTITSFMLFESGGYFKNLFKFLSKVGQNPMIAYTAGNLLLLPFLNLSGWLVTFNLLNSTALGGLIRGLLFTLAIALITLFFTQKRVFWKT